MFAILITAVADSCGWWRRIN